MYPQKFAPIAVILAFLVPLLLAAAPLAVDDRMQVSLRAWSEAEAVAADVDGIHTAITDSGSDQVVTTEFSRPPCPRNVTVTAGGTAADVKAISVTVTGLRNGRTISEAIGPFTVNATGTVAGAKIFDTVLSATVPAHDGTGATTSIGYGELLGLPYSVPYPVIVKAFKGGSVDASAVLTAGATLDGTHLDSGGALNGTEVALFYLKR